MPGGRAKRASEQRQTWLFCKEAVLAVGICEACGGAFRGEPALCPDCGEQATLAFATISGKILGTLFPIVTFVALGLQHSPANMGYFSIGLIHGDVGVGWGEAIWWNLVPASLGNLIGDAVLVALLFWYAFGRDPARTRALRRADELVRSGSQTKAQDAQG